MKKIALTISVLGMTIVSFAQLSGGIKGGVNLSSQKWEIDLMGQSASQKYDGVGFNIGGYLNYAVNEAFAVQPELLFNSLKFDIEGESVSLNYLSLPVMFGYGFDANKLILQAGPQLGVLLSSDPSEFKDDNYYTGIDFSLALGAQVNFSKFSIAVRYAIGLSNIVEDKLSDELELALGAPVDLTIKNSNLQFSVGYKLFGE